MSAARAAALAVAGAGLLFVFTTPRAAAPGETEPSPGLVRQIREIQAELEPIRGHAFRSPIHPAVLTEARARARLRSILDRDYPPGDLAREARELRYFDLIGPEDDLGELILGSLQGQVAGMYDPYDRELFVVEGSVEDDATLAHELTHALADQSFGLAPLLDAARRRDDETLALSAMLEGEATLTTMAWMKSREGAGAVSAKALEMGDASMFLGGLRMKIADRPPIIGESLVFPYEAGTAWAAARVRRGGAFAALDPFFKNPPESTEQILHPGKCDDPPDRPSVIDPDLLLAGRSRKSSDRDLTGEFGEFGLRILLGGYRSAPAVAAAQGWDGDLYRIDEWDGGPSMIWVSVWDSDEEGEEFLSAIKTWLAARAAEGGSRRGGAWEARRIGKIVVVAEGPGAEPARRVAAVAGKLPEGIRIR